jgi:hypothetical protein
VLVLAAALVLLPLAAQFFYLVPDSAGHVAWLHSLVWDRDVDFANDYARLGMIDREGNIAFGAPTPRGRPGNPFGLGSALVWMPAAAVAALLARLAHATGADVATDGFGTGTLLAVHLGTWTAALAALAAMAAALRAALPQRAAVHRLALAGAGLGTPFLAYTLQLPSFAHVASAFTTALLLWLSLAWRGQWTLRRAALLGAATGLAVLVRPQELVFAILPLALAGSTVRGRQGAPLLAVFVIALGVATLPQWLAWKAVYGELAIPQGSGFLRFSLANPLRVLFHTRHGLCVWSPVVALAIAGLVQLAREAPTRALGVAALTVLGLECLLNALPVDWWAGWSFGARRFVDCVPLFALGLAAWAGIGRAARIAIGVAIAAGLVLWLRVATRDLSGEADPGWNALWGSGCFGFLPRLPGAVVHWIATPWTELQVIRRPQATPPEFQVDPSGFLALVYATWAAGVVAAAAWRWRRQERR